VSTLTNFTIISDKPNTVEFKEGDKVFGKVEEITSRALGAKRTNVAKVTLQGPDVLHSHKEAEETYICLEGEGELYLDGQIFDFVPGTRVIIEPGIQHAARPKNVIEKLVILCVSSPAFDPNDVYEDSCGRVW
jgi:mannose-6-phosphate isomerase-like protein (cupin superfamily)